MSSEITMVQKFYHNRQ